MEYDELKRQIGKAGLTNKEFAKLIRINPNSITNFKKKSVPKNIAIIATLIAEMKEHRVDFKAVLNSFEIK
ncbi:XRE family transcriptional regulator [Idiomarina piscisalsi]|uniref:DNA-binding protein n=1 Tax=Idiomarina piscisalsi TaxID=1096243 RepID=A0A432YS87_9GAMM|nr:XRE family transcriptional regulator [Idiomarina piscisalsi]RUO64545.1 DNA-binding protein [Idiomarina piscisalsi]